MVTQENTQSGWPGLSFFIEVPTWGAFKKSMLMI